MTNRHSYLRKLTQQNAVFFFSCILLFMLSSCSSNLTSTPFIAPHGKVTLAPQSIIITPGSTLTLSPSTVTPSIPEIVPTSTTVVLPTDTNTPDTVVTPGASLENCQDSLIFISDTTYPDYSNVVFNQSIEKQWLVENNGTCDWNDNYHLRLLNGYPSFGAATDFTISSVPAGTQTIISINFIAPSEAGTYQTAWQLYNPQGIEIGKPVYMIIIVGQ
ncbi:MAG: NBR1-Ig-like domain-containing protein [Chloroflexota bacterium]